MPIYEYQCQKCKTKSEVFQKVHDKPLAKCPKCGGRLEKLISASAIQFKGSGWYVTDYAGRSKSDNSDSDGGKDDKASDKKAEKKKESSPATKSSSKASSSKVPSSD